MAVESWLRALHIAFFALGFAMSEGVSFFVQSLAKEGVADLRCLATRATLFGRIGAACWLGCALTGAWLAFQLGLNWSATWLVLSMGLFVILAVNGILGHSVWMQKVIEAGNGEPLGEAMRIKHIANIIGLLSISAILLLMVVKPA